MKLQSVLTGSALVLATVTTFALVPSDAQAVTVGSTKSLDMGLGDNSLGSTTDDQSNSTFDSGSSVNDAFSGAFNSLDLGENLQLTSDSGDVNGEATSDYGSDNSSLTIGSSTLGETTDTSKSSQNTDQLDSTVTGVSESNVADFYENELFEESVATESFTLNNTGTVGANGLTLETAPVTVIPEPLTVIGTAMALGFGGLFQREYSKRQKK